MRALALALIGLTAQPALAQTPQPAPAAAPSAVERLRAAEQDSQNLQRAINLARNTAVQLNGGLGLYQPGLCMVEARRAKECVISRGPAGLVFRFPGGTPGWVAEQRPASFETELSIAADGRSVLKVIYNGAPRTTTASPANPTPCPCVCPPASAPARS